MTGEKISEILDSVMSFYCGCGKIAEDADNRKTNGRNKYYGEIYAFGKIEFQLENEEKDSIENSSADNSADGTFNCFLGRNYRRKLMLSEESSAEISECIRKPAAEKREKNKENTVCLFEKLGEIKICIPEKNYTGKSRGNKRRTEKRAGNLFKLGILKIKHHYYERDKNYCGYYGEKGKCEKRSVGKIKGKE